MSNKDTISHDGQVVEILPDKYKIKIITKSACASCHAKSVCNPSDQAEKIIDAVWSDEQPDTTRAATIPAPSSFCFVCCTVPRRSVNR